MLNGWYRGRPIGRSDGRSVCQSFGWSVGVGADVSVDQCVGRCLGQSFGQSERGQIYYGTISRLKTREAYRTEAANCVAADQRSVRPNMSMTTNNKYINKRIDIGSIIGTAMHTTDST